MTSIEVYRVIAPERAEGIRKALKGRSYMKFQVSVVPVLGEFAVTVSTDRPDTTEEELRELVLFTLCGDLAFGRVY